MSILLLCDDDPNHANTILDHIAAFSEHSLHTIRTFNPRGLARSRWLELDDFDVVVVHYSLAIISDHHLSPHFREKLRRFQGLKIQFIQDDYRWVDAITAMMRYVGIHVLFTLVPEPEIPKIWDETRLPGVVKLTTLAGYVPDDLIGLQGRPLRQRPLDIGYRGRVLPFWIGRIGQEKTWIAQGVVSRAGRYGLRCDIGWREEDRIYGSSWIDFIASCRATLGSESGATITDFDGSIERRVKEYLRQNPSADFSAVHREVLAPVEGNVRMNVISPRFFEAIALRTALILFPGDYSGILEPWRHYIPLEKDFSNMDEVVEKLRDDTFLQELTDRAYQEVAASGRYSYATLIRQFDEVVSRHATGRVGPVEPRHVGGLQLRTRHLRYGLARVERLLLPRLRNSPLGVAARSAVRTYVLLRVMMADRALQRILWFYIADGGSREAINRTQLVRDLLRLGLLIQGATGRLKADKPFRVCVVFDRAQGLLSFVSQSAGLPNEHATPKGRCASLDQSRLESALQAGEVRDIVWNHSDVGSHVSYPWNRWTALRVRLEDHGVYHFDAVAALAPRAPQQVWSALMLLLSDPGVACGARDQDRSV